MVHVHALVALILGVILLGNARTASGSDAGGKLATVVAMADRGTWSPDLGYWAEDADPDGVHHPLWHTEYLGEQWVQAKGVVGFCPANQSGDDVIVWKDEARTTEIGRFHMLRQQMEKTAIRHKGEQDGAAGEPCGL